MKPVSLPLPKCGKCKKILEPRFTTEQEGGDVGRPKVLVMFGDCIECNVRTISNIIETKDIPDNLDALENKEVNKE